jgi:hypothetical protein
MRRSFHHAALLLALCAMLLRGAMPLGWMPGNDGAFMAMCTANGMVQLGSAAAIGLLDSPAPPSSSSAEHPICPFAAGASLGAAVAAFVLPAASDHTFLVEPAYQAPLLAFAPSRATQSRAPPLLLQTA